MAITTVTIAKLANTTHATVSRALRDDPSISLKTRQQIKKIAEELGYRPNLLARGLAKGKTHTIGLLMSSYQLEIGATKVVVLDELVSNMGYRIYVSYTKGEVDRTIESANELIDRGVDGLIIYGSYAEESPDVLKEKFSWDVPVVFFGVEQKFPCRQVIQDKSTGVRQAVKHLYNLGHREIYMLFAYWTYWNTDSRFDGFIKAMKDIGNKNPEKRMCIITTSKSATEEGITIYDENNMLDNIKKFLQSHPECTAVVCGNDIVAMNVIRAAWEMGIKVPEDISVVGFDNIHTSRYTYPPLTTVAQPVKKIVSAAWKLLLDSMENKDANPKKIVIPSELVIRNSTAVARTNG